MNFCSPLCPKYGTRTFDFDSGAGRDFDVFSDPNSLEPVSKSFEEDNEAGKLHKAEEIVGVVLPANEDPALPLNPGEEALDEPASHVAA
jgi:hypothetical protein